MLFQSQVFILLFLPAVLGAYYLSAERPVLREAILILASLLFYAWWTRASCRSWSAGRSRPG